MNSGYAQTLSNYRRWEMGITGKTSRNGILFNSLSREVLSMAEVWAAGTELRIEELTVSRFCVDISGLVVAVFSECSGLGGEIEVETYREGGVNDFEHKLPGPAKYGNLTLKSGVAASAELWEWFHSVATGNIERREVSIVMYLQNRDGPYQGEAVRWNLSRAYPVRWEGPSFTADDNNVAVHSLELAHHGITRA